jgi:hypothetical protein
LHPQVKKVRYPLISGNVVSAAWGHGTGEGGSSSARRRRTLATFCIRTPPMAHGRNPNLSLALDFLGARSFGYLSRERDSNIDRCRSADQQSEDLFHSQGSGSPLLVILQGLYQDLTRRIVNMGKFSAERLNDKVARSAVGRWFRLDGCGHPLARKGSRFTTELRAGSVIGAAMLYIIAVNSSVLVSCSSVASAFDRMYRRLIDSVYFPPCLPV